MPPTSGSIAWLTDHAVLLLAVSVTITVAGELLNGRL